MEDILCTGLPHSLGIAPFDEVGQQGQVVLLNFEAVVTFEPKQQLLNQRRRNGNIPMPQQFPHIELCWARGGRNLANAEEGVDGGVEGLGYFREEVFVVAEGLFVGLGLGEGREVADKLGVAIPEEFGAEEADIGIRGWCVVD
jgi:hypothetical protein